MSVENGLIFGSKEWNIDMCYRISKTSNSEWKELGKKVLPEYLYLYEVQEQRKLTDGDRNQTSFCQERGELTGNRHEEILGVIETCTALIGKMFMWVNTIIKIIVLII